VNAANVEYAKAAGYRLERGDVATTLVLLHGLGGDRFQPWPYASGAVREGQANRLAPDARGHGATALSDLGPLDFATLAGDVVALVDYLGLPRNLIALGISMGAATALRLALDGEATLRGLILIRPAWLNRPDPPNLAVFSVIAALLRRYGPIEGRSRFAVSNVLADVASRSPSAASSLLEQFDRPFALERARRLEEIPRSAPFRSYAALRTLEIPVLVIGAPDDPVHPLATAKALARAIPTSEFVTVGTRDGDPKAFHQSIGEASEAFVLAL